MLLLACCIAIFAGCGGSTPATTGAQGKTSSPNGGVTSKALPVPAYPQTEPDEVYDGVFKMITTDSFDQVIGFYKKELPAATFSQIKIDTGRGASFLVDSDAFHGNVSVEENLPSNGEVTITVSSYKTN